MIHFDFEDRYQDELVVGSALSRRDGVFLSVFVHAALLFAILFGPSLALFRPNPEELEKERQELLRRERDRQRFVFIQPRLDIESPKPRPEVDLSDLNRRAQAPKQAQNPENPLPQSLGNTPERVESPPSERARGQESETPNPPQVASNEDTQRRPPVDDNRTFRAPLSQPPRAANGNLGAALRNLQRYVQSQTFHNPKGGDQDPGATIQFDSKGIDFGPWLRRFQLQVYSNWYVPDAILTFKGRVVLQFNIHKDGRITDLVVVQPSDIGGFTRAAYNAILGSNPTEPLPPEYPDEKALFTVTFFYNEYAN